MYSAFDLDNLVWYLGEVPPYERMAEDLLNNAQILTVDVETVSTLDRRPIGIGISPRPDVAFFFLIEPQCSPRIPYHLLSNPNILKILHNASFDLHALSTIGIFFNNILDTTIMSRTCGEVYNDLRSLSGKLYMAGKSKVVAGDMGEVLQSHNVRYVCHLPIPIIATKCCEDILATWAVYQRYWPECNQEYCRVEAATIPIMAKMSLRGISIDQEWRGWFEEQLDRELATFTAAAEDLGINLGSNQQVGYMLCKRGAYRDIFLQLPMNKDKTMVETSEDILNKLNDPLARLTVMYRKIRKLQGTYIRPLAGLDRVHTRFHLDAATGRPSSSKPNMQNIPTGLWMSIWLPHFTKQVREMFLPDTGVWTDMDFSQTELRVLAYVSGDMEMQYIFSLPDTLPDGSRNYEADIHQQTATFLGIPRKIAKNVNFAMVYGGDNETLATTAGIEDPRKAAQLRDGWFRKFPDAGRWIASIQQRGLMDGYVETVFGRRMYLPRLVDEGEAAIGRKACNWPIQGTAADVLKRALIICDKEGLDMALQVHDEILFDGKVEIPDDLSYIIPDMIIPTTVKMLRRWR